ncbi:MAG: glycine oxidase ThiO [Gemmatimonadota bacterium]
MKVDVAIIGAGLIGCAVARKVARGGGSVVVIDRDTPARQASWAAAGMLAPQAESNGPGDFLSLLLRARAGFPAVAQELERETGVGVGYRNEGAMLIALNEADEAELERRFGWQRAAGLEAERLTGGQARKLESALSTETRAALLFRGDHQVDNRLLGRALWFSAVAAGAEFRIGEAVKRVHDADEVAVELAHGGRIEAETLVIAAGCWSGQIPGLPRVLPVEPVHGQLLSIETGPPLLRHVMGSLRGYLVPRADGRLIVGTTVDHMGFRTAVTPAGLQRLTSIAIEIAPAVADQPVAAHWSGLRPGTPDGLPILGRDPDSPRIIYATGHFRNGILLGPLTGEIIGSLALGGAPGLDLSAFRPDRFLPDSDPERPALHP